MEQQETTASVAIGDEIWSSRTVQVLGIFGVMCLVASAVPSPWWRGNLLDVQVRWPKAAAPLGLVNSDEGDGEPPPPLAVADGQGQEGQGAQDPQEDVSAVDQATTVDRLKEMEEAVRQRMKARAAQLTAQAAKKRAAENKKILAALAPELKSLGAPSVALELPCVVKTTDGKGCQVHALDAFFEELREVALEQREEPVRVSQYGDSLISGDAITGELRRRFQEMYGDGGHGYIPLKAPTRFMGFEGLWVSASDEGWKVDAVVRGSSKPRDLGVAGVSFTPKDKKPRVKVRSRDSKRTFNRVGLLASVGDQPLELRLTGQNKLDQRVEIKATQDDNMRWVPLAQGVDRLELSGFGGDGTYYGLFVENAGSGVVVDNMGMLSAKMASLRRIESKHWRQQLTARGVNLASFAFGVNSASPRRPSSGWLKNYKQIYKVVLSSALDPAHKRDCLVLSVLTRASKQGEEIKPFASVKHIVQAQREVALETGCAFWDMNAFIGGEEGPAKWYNNRPRLLGSDFSHPTHAGYRRLGKALFGALLHAFVAYLERDTRQALASKAP